MISRESTSGLVAAVTLLAAPLLYVTSYFALVQVRYSATGASVPYYRKLDCDAVRISYRPLHELDRLARPQRWIRIPFYSCPPRPPKHKRPLSLGS
jgi:hypothetical protein